ncbi:Cysteine desulfurase IscS [Acaryochloris thomasi RCC1774]|uniref:cysteine desulfurase n=1 Tax=Acaryochloris thomasi RCC1774 TaxID=1764569 RepID=A0A2W1JMD7_9CYAN|nr:cysteine desulfurase family protein [Acaryochloris thomasi]PZD72042.1 Cysteine desulfurase IscS [Acaryochloris thomasi RCC1774]
MQIYLDYGATTPCCKDAIASMQNLWQHQWGNPSSLHQWGQRSATALEEARIQVAELIGASAETLTFTSGGTEADNLALLGVAHQYTTPQHLIISSIEHSAVSNCAQWLESQGWQVTRLSVNRQGLIDPAQLQKALQPNTTLVSIIYGQSEVGTLQPIEVLGRIVRDHGALFHTDAVQVAGRLPIDVQALPVDLLSLSSHKLYGPQGAGALYVRPGITLTPMLTGGGQEAGLRSGTPAVPTMVGFGVAAALAAQDMAHETERLRKLRDRLFEQLSPISELFVTGDRQQRLPHHASFYLQPQGDSPISGRAIVRQMNLAGIAISAGSACHSGTLSPSPILKAMGYSDAEARAGIRLTLGRATTEADIDWVAVVLPQVLTQLGQRTIAGVR